MNDQQGRAIPSRPIPRRPSSLPRRPSSLPKRSSLQSGSSQSISDPLPPESEQSSMPPSAQSNGMNHPTLQSPMHARPSSTQSDDGYLRSALAEIATVKSTTLPSKAEIATVKSMALRSKASLEGKSGPIPYPAIINCAAPRLKVSPERKGSLTPYPAMIRSKRARKWGLLAWVSSFAFLK